MNSDRIPLMRLTSQQISYFQKKIFIWWKTNRRDLPWRRTNDPYKILVSEVMLQQTQVARVLPKYNEFLTLFPSVRALAEATPANILRAWKGMGYNRRALYLKKSSQTIVDVYNGKFPKTEKELCKLSGLGTYTARALLVFAYKQDVAMVDTNIRQILTHFFFNDIPQKEVLIEEVADQLLPKGKSWEWHQALMDYGAIAMSHLRQGFGGQAKVKKKTVPFKESNRFYRGRIIDRLREGDVDQSNLIQEFTGIYRRSEDFIVMILQGLEADGLISRSKTGIISLPK